MEKGLIHIYCGDGKGKTTAALGLAVRAAGRGKQVLILRLLKTEDSGEVAVLRKIPGITVIPCEKSFGFLSRMKEEEKKQASAWYESKLKQAEAMAMTGRYDMLILDEAMAAINGRIIREDGLLQFLKKRPAGLEVVLTGRSPSERLLKEADYVSDIQAVKHPFTKGIGAREGIEF